MLNLYTKTEAYVLIRALKECRRDQQEEQETRDAVRCVKALIRCRLLFPRQGRDLVDLVALCGRRQFRNSPVLRVVLMRVFKCMHRLRDKELVLQNLFFVVLCSRVNVDHFYGTCNATRFRMGGDRFPDLVLRWLVRHTNLLRIQDDNDAFFRTWDHRLLQAVLNHGCSELLRVGSFTAPPLACDEATTESTVSRHQLVDLLFLALFALFLSLNYRRMLIHSREERSELVNCIAVIFRVVPWVSPRLLYRRARTLLEEDACEMLTYTMWWLSFSGTLPHLYQRLGTDVASLKHLSRCSIRRVLYKNWALPQGLGSLNLPRDLYLYISLAKD